MLLRSSSLTALNSWIPHLKDSYTSSEYEFTLHIVIPKSRSYSAISMSSVSFDDQIKKMSRILSESTNLREFKTRPLNWSKCMCLHGFPSSSNCIDDDDDAEVLARHAGVDMELQGGCEVRGGDGVEVETAVGAGGGGRNRRVYGGRSGGSGFWDSSNGITEKMDVYYQKMVESDPGNAMILSNYARFLKEFRGDLVKAEEYCGRAILANPSDGTVLSLYADLIWQIYEDSKRAEVYFDQAIKAAPDDSHVWGSYARFLWDAEDEFEGEEERILL